MVCRCGNVAAILELDEHLNKSFKVRNILMYLLFFFKILTTACMHPGRRRVCACSDHGRAIIRR